MNKTARFILIAVVAALGLSSCSDEAYDSKYKDPSKTGTVTCDKLMTGVFLQGKQYGMTTYWRLFTFDTQFLGRLCNTYGYTSAKGAYAGVAESYNDNRWTNFYNMLTQLKLQEYTYNNLDETNRKKNKVFVDCAKIYVYDQLQQMVDLWGDVPYSKACTVQITYDVASSYASYDKATDIYKTMLDDLKTITTELSSMELDADIASAFAKQDFINQGNLSLWAKYANGLRARIALRCATQGDLTAEGQAALKECFDGSAPIISGNDDEVLINVGTTSGDFNLVENSEFGLRDGWESWNHACNTASQVMLDAMNANTANEDPRLQVMFAYNNKDKKYRGQAPTEVPATQTALRDSMNYYSCLDSATFSRNYHYLEPKMTAAEVDLTHADAIARGYVSGDAKTYFVKGVIESINYYYKLNAASEWKAAKPRPDDAAIKAYAESQWDAANPQKCIATQYWIHMGIGNTVQALMNVRRTGYPELTFVDWSSTSVDCPVPVDRLHYPSSEVQNNPTNLKAALQSNFGGEDTWYHKIFWAKESKSWFKTIAEPK